MLSLKEASILETFGTLDEERQEVLLQLLLVQSPLLNICSTDHMSPSMKKLFNFCLRKWSIMSKKFFTRICERWDFITENSLCYCRNGNSPDSYGFQVCQEGKCKYHSPNYALYEFCDRHWNSLYLCVKPEYEDDMEDYLLSKVLTCPEDEYRKILEICGYSQLI